MDPARLAAQLYTVREHTQNAADLRRTFRKIRDIGYPAVQISAIGRIDPSIVAGLLEETGLTCCITHTAMDRLEREPSVVVGEHRLWNCPRTAIGSFRPESLDVADWRRFADRMNKVAAALAAGGVSLGYHNHSHELAKVDGVTILDRLLGWFDPSIEFELDTYWLAHGGCDPAAWIRKVAGRMSCVHLKDMGIRYPDRPIMMEVGEGNLDWPAILSACRDAGVEWYVVEQDTCYRDPFESLAISFENLTRM